MFHPPLCFRHPWMRSLLGGGDDRCVCFVSAREGGWCICPRSERPLHNPDSARDGSRSKMVLGARGECLPVSQGLILVFHTHIPRMTFIAHVFVAPRVAHVGERGRIEPSGVSRGGSGYTRRGIHMLHSGALFPFGLTSYGCTSFFGRGRGICLKAVRGTGSTPRRVWGDSGLSLRIQRPYAVVLVPRPF